MDKRTFNFYIESQDRIINNKRWPIETGRYFHNIPMHTRATLRKKQGILSDQLSNVKYLEKKKEKEKKREKKR